MRHTGARKTHIEEHFVNLFQRSVFRLGEVEIYQDRAEGSDAAEDEPHLCAEVDVVKAQEIR
jgi:hypothetical protein